MAKKMDELEMLQKLLVLFNEYKCKNEFIHNLINAKNNKGETPLMCALKSTIHGKYENTLKIVELSCEAGADITIADINNDKPIDIVKRRIQELIKK